MDIFCIKYGIGIQFLIHTLQSTEMEYTSNDLEFLERSPVAAYLVWPARYYNCPSLFSNSLAELVQTLSNTEATLAASHSDDDTRQISNFMKFLKQAIEYRQSESGAKRWEKRLKVESKIDALKERIKNTPPGNDRRFLELEYDRLDDIDFDLESKEHNIGERAYTASKPWTW
jgi:hypothetical protein